MLFRTESNSPLGYGKFVFGFCDKTPEGDLEFYNLGQLLTDNQIASATMFRKDFNLMYTRFEDSNYIMPQLDDFKAYDDNQILDLNDNYSFEALVAMKDDDKFYNELIEIIEQYMYAGFSKYKNEFIECILQSSDVLNKIASNEFYYTLNSSVVVDKNTMLDYNENTAGTPVNYTTLKKTKNSSKPMLNYDDELSLYIPPAFYIPQGTIDEYGEDIYKENLDNFTISIFNQISCIRPFGIPAADINALNYEDKKDLNTFKTIKGVLSDFPSKYIDGDERNNKISLQKNEENFYNRLVTFIDAWFTKYQKATELSDDIIQSKKEGAIVPVELMDIFRTFIMFALSINWRFRKYTPLEYLINYGEGSDDDDDSGSSDEGVSNHVFAFDASTDTAMQAIENIDVLGNINNFIAQTNSTIYAYAEIIIKLLRWGDIKPSKLYIMFEKSMREGIKSPYYLDLVNLHREYDSEVLDSLVLKDSEYDAKLVGLIYNADREYAGYNDVSELNILKNLNLDFIEIVPKAITGVILMQTLGNKDDVNSDVNERYLFTDFRSLVSLIRDKDYKVDGIYYKDSKFIVDTDEDLSKTVVYSDFVAKLSSNETQVGKLLNYNEKLVKAFPELTLKQLNTCNYFNIFDEIALSQGIVTIQGVFSNKALATAHLNLLRYLYKYFYKVSNQSPETLEQSLELYLEATDEVNSNIPAQEKTSNEMTNKFTSEPNKDAPKIKATHLFNFEELNMIKTEDNRMLVLNPDEFDASSAATITGKNALIKILTFSIDKGRKSGYPVSDEDVAKVTAFIEQKMGTNNLVNAYKALMKK